MKNKGLILISLAICVMFAFSSCKGAGPTQTLQPTTNIDGTPVELKPAVGKDGKQLTNDQGYNVYEVQGETDEEGNPIYVAPGGTDQETKQPSYVIQEWKTNEDGTKILTDLKDPQSGNLRTTTFKGEYRTTSGGQSVTNIDGTPGAVKPVVDENGKQVENENGLPVYELNDKDSSGNTVYVVPDSPGDNSNFVVQEKSTDNSGGSSFKDITDKDGTPVTTNFEDWQPTTGSGSSDSMPESVDLGGVFGVVTRYDNNVYKGTFDKDKLDTLKTPVEFSTVGITITQGVYIPETLGQYRVVQVAALKLTVYSEDDGYEYYAVRGVFYPGEKNPVLYLGTPEILAANPSGFEDMALQYRIELAAK